MVFLWMLNYLTAKLSSGIGISKTTLDWYQVRCQKEKRAGLPDLLERTTIGFADRAG
jgi:hypothetical protein